eukprot:31250-Pelagococcus_subviridis.AAC.7
MPRTTCGVSRYASTVSTILDLLHRKFSASSGKFSRDHSNAACLSHTSHGGGSNRYRGRPPINTTSGARSASLPTGCGNAGLACAALDIENGSAPPAR